MRHRPYRTYIVVVVFVATIWAAPDAAACTCVFGGCGEVAKADAVFVATVERVAASVPPNGNVARERVVHLTGIRPLRGQAQATVVTGQGDGDCGYDFQSGTRYLIVADRANDGRLWTSICTLTRPLDEAAALIAYIESLNAPADGGRVWGRVWQDRPARNVPSALSGARVTIRGPIEGDDDDRRGRQL